MPVNWFPTFDDVHAWHAELLRRRRSRESQDEVVKEARELLDVIQWYGQVSTDQVDRARLESYSAYWGALIFENTGTYPDTSLEQAFVLPEVQAPTVHGATGVDDERLAQAEARLAAMPLDVVPPPASLPAGSRMPLARNPLFVGRDADLKALARALKAGETAAVGQIAAATGLGGIGKTQLASEFVHRYGQYFLGGSSG
jgi:hypothetical protein